MLRSVSLVFSVLFVFFIVLTLILLYAFYLMLPPVIREDIWILQGFAIVTFVIIALILTYIVALILETLRNRR